mmetsp:Transcript_90943/g.253049  ORF Transcript_90943/g.253049 Transcript_90943/m.253049 type:complete len:227 (-) Transcript_90943:248-928(-)
MAKASGSACRRPGSRFTRRPCGFPTMPDTSTSWRWFATSLIVPRVCPWVGCTRSSVLRVMSHVPRFGRACCWQACQCRPKGRRSSLKTGPRRTGRPLPSTSSSWTSTAASCASMSCRPLAWLLVAVRISRRLSSPRRCCAWPCPHGTLPRPRTGMLFRTAITVTSRRRSTFGCRSHRSGAATASSSRVSRGVKTSRPSRVTWATSSGGGATAAAITPKPTRRTTRA